MEAKFINPKQNTLEDKIDLLRSLFKVNEEYGKKHGRNFVCMDFRPYNEPDAIFIKWLMNTKYDAYYYDEECELRLMDEKSLTGLIKSGEYARLFFLEKN